MVSYDPQVITKFADKLYKRATSVIIVSVLVGLFIGGIAGFFSHSGEIFIIAGLMIGALLGLAVGFQLAFKLKLQAQTALCQLEIEQNTREKKSKEQ